jgi:DNA-binding NtrC family response regulator
MPARLLEAEMFGYERNATGEVRETRNGSIGIAAGGTLFLDGIGDMDLALQQKLARTLEHGHYARHDGIEEIALSARLICATRVDPKAGERNPTILEEFLEGSAHHHARLLPLRKRKEDIPQLCEYLLEKFARNFGRPAPHLSSVVLDAFQRWDWPGNIRELENWIARIVIFGTEEAIGLEFSRQLAAWVAPVQRRHRATNLKMGRTRRLRKHE